MSKTKKKINPITAERVKLIISREKLTQERFAEIIDKSLQSVNRICNCKQPLTEETAEAIQNIFPTYRTEWILGYDNFMTEAEKNAFTIAQGQKAGDCLFSGLYLLGHLCGYELNGIDVSSGMDIESAIDTLSKGYAITHNGATVQLSLDEMNDFENHICDIVEAELKYLFKRKGIDTK